MKRARISHCMLGATAHRAVPTVKRPIAVALAARRPRMSQSLPKSGVKVMFAKRKLVPSHEAWCEALKEDAMGLIKVATMVMSMD